MEISETDLFLATSKFTDQETARLIVSSVKGIVADEVISANSNLATKGDFYTVKEDIQNAKAELKEDVQNVKSELKEDIQNVKTELYKVKAELKENIFQVESRLSAKIYIVGLVQFLAIAGTVISVIAYMLQIR